MVDNCVVAEPATSNVPRSAAETWQLRNRIAATAFHIELAMPARGLLRCVTIEQPAKTDDGTFASLAFFSVPPHGTRSLLYRPLFDRQHVIEARVEGRNVVETPDTKVAPVIDIMEALKRSLAEKRKPAQTATAAAGAEEEVEAVAEEAAPAKRVRKTKVG